MKFPHYKKRLEESAEFKQFKKKHKKSYLCAGFFILDYEQGKNSVQIDYLLPNKKIATFNLDEGVKMNISEKPVEKPLAEISQEAIMDLDKLKLIVEDEMKNHVVTEKIKKIIAILHIIDNRLVWNLQCIMDGLGILLVHINDADSSLLKFEKHSIMEFVKKA